MNLRHQRVIAVVAGAVTLVGLGSYGAVAAGLVGSAEIRNNSVRSVDIHNGTIRQRDLSAPLAQRLGSPGPRGARGPAGPRGATGPVGPQGPGAIRFLQDSSTASTPADILVTGGCSEDQPFLQISGMHGNSPLMVSGTLTVDNTTQTVSDASTDYYHFLADAGQTVHFTGTVGATDGTHAYLVDVHIFSNCVTPGALVPLS